MGLGPAQGGGGGTAATSSNLATVMSNTPNPGVTGGTSLTLSSGDKITAAAGADVTLNAPASRSLLFQLNGSTSWSLPATGILTGGTGTSLNVPVVNVSGPIIPFNAPSLSLTQNWNGASSFVAGYVNITDTSSNADSKLFSWRVGASDRVSFYKNGTPFFSDNGTLPYIITNSNANMIQSWDSIGVTRAYFANATPGMVEQLGSSRGTTASPTAIQSGDLTAAWESCAYIGPTSAHAVNASIRFYEDGAPTDNVSNPGRIDFQTTPAGSLTPTTRVRINSAGSLIVNATGSNLAQNATDGFLYVPVCATGAPSGTPTSVTGAAPVVVQGTTLYFYGGGSWNAVSSGGAASSPTLFYGDGSSGSGTMDGAATVFGLVPSGNVYTATANIYATSLTVNSGVTLNMANYRLFCSVALTNNGTIHCNGGAASGSTGGSAVAAGFFAASPAGVNGLTTVLSSQPGSSAAATGGAFGGGGGGGRSDGTQQAAGSAATPSVTFLWAIRTGQAFGGSAANPTTLFSNSASNNNQAAGRGSGDGTNAGGGSGGGGGSLAIQAKTITTGASGVYSANGGNGGNGAGGTAGGGGGGAGGAVGLWANSYSGTALVAGTNVTATHGNGGNGSTTAGAGTNGVDGKVYIITLQ